MLQIRQAGLDAIIGEVENRTPGDAILFPVHPTLRHRVGPVEGAVPRTAYAGWFRAQPDFRERLIARLQPAE